MPLQKLQLRPGVNRENTTYSGEGGWFDCDKIRFRSGFPEKIGGWQNISGATNAVLGVNVSLLPEALLDASTNQQPEKTLFKDTLISGRPLGDINNSGTVTSADSLIYLNWIRGLLTNAAQIAYIETVLNPYMVANPTTYAAYLLFTSEAYKGVCRNLWNWVTLNSSNLLALGTEQKLYVENGGAYYDITPIRNTSTINTDPFDTVDASRLVTVTDTAHGATTGTYVTFSGATTVGGLDLNAEFEVVTIIDANSYQIISPISATSTANGGGAAVDAAYQTNAGNSVYSAGNGWGIGPWSRDGWGDEFSGTSVAQETNQLRLWSLDNYGQDLVAAVREGAIYYWAADTTTSPPRAVTLKSLAAAAGFDDTFVPNRVFEAHTSGVQRFTICIGANPYDPGNANTDFDPMLVRWSDQENIYQWVPAADNQAGELRFSHGSRLVTGRHGRQEFVVWSDSAIYSMQYLGPPYVWGVNLLMEGISIASPNAVVGASNLMFWMGVDKFYMYDGRVQTLPCTVRQFVFDNINQDQLFQVVAGGSEQYSEVWWFYPSLNSTVNDRYVIYNYLDNVWYYGTLNRTAWLDSSLRPRPMGAFSIKTSYLSAAILPTDTTINVLDASSYPASGVLSIDGEQVFYGSRTSVALNDCVRGYNGTTAVAHSAYIPCNLLTPNQIMFHEVGNDDLSLPEVVPIVAYITSSDFDIGDGHNFGFIWRILPDLTFDGSTTPAPNLPAVTMVCRPRQNSGAPYGTPDTPTVTSAQSYNSERVYTVQQFTGQVYTRVRGRQMQFEIRSDGIGVAWQLGSPRLDIRSDGRR